MKVCKAELHIADDEGDNHATMVCGLHEGHIGPHRECYPRDTTVVIVTWHGDERVGKRKPLSSSQRKSKA